ncbi:amino acid permease/ SLC12A domain-containing protein [Bombardia bombarda]|uniref:Amino acid permease/ SLC12A domain-containing protein n=1 Tax=Bombardia bombarda TaxID=252184 RepID=A0AA40CA31_9PEZI|nr:amino acid permease/ SLC12A domain-containing protein [Bombardia bombarda]
MPKLQRRLKSRHLQMIAIGGTIGTGLFIGSGSALATSGPAGSLIAYAFVGSIVYSVMVALGEMATYIPISGAFTSYATRFIDPSAGFAMGWIYWFSWAITFALELTITGLLVQYWDPSLNIGIFIAVFWVFITICNLLPVSFYGEFEFWFSMVKVITVVAFMIFAICINAGAGQEGYIGFRYWHEPGAFAPYILDAADPVAKFVGFWAVLIQAGFSYQGTELVGIAAGETENPRKNVPAAIRKTFWRILFFFVFTIFFIGILVPYDDARLLTDASDATASPFVIAVQRAGVRHLPGILNAVLLFVVLSAANSNVYSGSRILVGLANDGSAPRILGRSTTSGVPIYAVCFTAAIGLLAFLNLSASAAEVFNWFLNITAVAGFITWANINVAHIRFMKALAYRQISRDSLPYKAFWQPWFSWYGLFWNILITLTQGFTAFMPWSTSKFFVAYISLILWVIMYVGHLIYRRTLPTLVKVEDIDIITGCVDYEGEVWEEKVPKNLWEKFWNWL